MDGSQLPIESLRGRFLKRIELHPVVLSSPTGSGKSTQVPRWCSGLGRVLVVEPRRVACRSLAQRVAQLESARLGHEIGYHVRDEHKARGSTRILFATPGVVLRIFEDIHRFDTVIVDEFHERGLEVDLLMALMMQRIQQDRFKGRLVVMSATLDGERLAHHVGGEHLHAEGRTFPVDVKYLPGRVLLPDIQGLEDRLRQAVDEAREVPGDILVFLPGKGEIAAAAKCLAGRRELELMPLHGGLNLAEQSRIFEPPSRRRVILATNVAETSLTVPGVGVVIDSGLVRQTRYVRDRGFLTLVPIAQDSAEQRTGRAGRTSAGLSIRLWSEAAQLEERTAPEIHRESLVPLVLAAAAQGERCDDLPFADPPKAHALETAQDELETLGALEKSGQITERGRRLFGLPLEADQGRWLVEAEQRDETQPGLLADMVDLVAALSVDRPILDPPSDDELEDDPNAACDAVALIRALRGGLASRIRRPTLEEAKAARRRLVTAFGLGARPAAQRGPLDIHRRRLADCLLAADRRVAHIPRRRGKRLAWSNGGTEIELGRNCGSARAEDTEALLVLSTVALGLGGRDARVLVTQAMPVPLHWLVEAGLGRDRLDRIDIEDGVMVAKVQRTYAKKVLSTHQTVPQGKLARKAMAQLFLDRRIFSKALPISREHYEATIVARRLASRLDEIPYWLQEVVDDDPNPPAFDRWVIDRLTELGVTSGEDLGLLSEQDLIYPALSTVLREELDRTYPRRLKIDGVDYRVDYELEQGRIVLRIERGKPQKPPGLFYLPRFPGFKILVEFKGVLRTIR